MKVRLFDISSYVFLQPRCILFLFKIATMILHQSDLLLCLLVLNEKFLNRVLVLAQLELSISASRGLKFTSSDRLIALLCF